MGLLAKAAKPACAASRTPVGRPLPRHPAQAGFVAERQRGPSGAVSTARAPSQREHAVPRTL